MRKLIAVALLLSACASAQVIDGRHRKVFPSGGGACTQPCSGSACTDNFAALTNFTVNGGAFSTGTNAYWGNSGGTVSIARYTAGTPTWTNKEYAKVTIVGINNTGGAAGPACFVQSGTAMSGYIVHWGGGVNNGMTLYLANAGSYTSKGTYTGITTGDVIEIDCNGTTGTNNIVVKKNGVAVITASDATWTSGAGGITAFGADALNKGGTFEAGCF